MQGPSHNTSHIGNLPNSSLMYVFNSCVTCTHCHRLQCRAELVVSTCVEVVDFGLSPPESEPNQNFVPPFDLLYLLTVGRFLPITAQNKYRTHKMI